MNPPPADPPSLVPLLAAGGSFPTTHWSMIVHAGANSKPQARAALEMLCRQYWYPIYVFLRRQDRAHHEAEDCTQEFLARLLANDGIASARRERGRFRTFLLTALRNFLTNEWYRAQAAKRGGGATLISLDLRDAQDRFAHEPADTALSPEQAFDRNWAHGLIDETFAELRTEYEKNGRGTLFAALRPLAWGNAGGSSIAQHSERVGLNPHAFTVALHRFRRRLGERLRARVAETVANGADLDAELHHLIAAVRHGTPAP